MTAPLTKREFIEWFRDSHMIDGRRLKFVMGHDGKIINLDRMTNKQVEAVVEQLMMLESHFEGRA